MNSATVTGTDGKSYPARPQTATERLAAIGLAHQLHCGQKLSVRAVRARLAERGVQLSTGTVHRYLTTYTCLVCRTPPAQPEQVSAAVFRWR